MASMRKKFLRVCSFSFLGLVFLLLLCLNLFWQDHWLDSDMAAEMIFSRLLAEEGRFFATPDWYYSTEFRFLYTHLVMGPLFRLTDNWRLIRLITNLASYFLMTVSCFYLMRPLKVKREWTALTAAVLLLPFSETMMLHMEMGNTYPWHVILLYFSFGLYLRLAAGTEYGRFRRRWLWFCYLLLAVICGVSGVRYLLALQCPLVLAAGLYLLQSEEYGLFRAAFGTGRESRERFAGLIRSPQARCLYCALWGAGGGLVGYGVNVLWVSRQYVFQTYGGTNFISVYQGVLGERVQNALGSLLMLFGYIPDRGVISLRGIITISSFIVIALFSYFSVRACKKSRGPRRFAVLFAGTALALNVFMFVFTTSTMVPRYYLTVFIFVLPAVAFYMEQEEFLWDKMLAGGILAVCLCLGAAKTTLSFITTDKNGDRREVAAFLEERYEFGYATYWNANIITELTGGKVEVANILDPEGLQFFTWSTPMKYYEEGFYRGKVFLLLEASEAAEYADAPALLQGSPVYEDGSYVAYEYESMEKLLSCRPEGGREQVR